MATRPERETRRKLALGLYAEPGLTELAEEVAERLPEQLSERFEGLDWKVEVGEEVPKDPAANTKQLLEVARRRLLDEGWDFVICLTRLPLRLNRRPVTAHASASDGVGLISVPALGAIDVEDRAREAVIHLIEGLVGESAGTFEQARNGHSNRVQARLQEVASPIGRPQVRDGRIRFVTAAVRGNLRLLLGMVRANDPWRVIARLSRAMVAALGTAAYALSSTGVWTLATGMTWPRLAGFTVVALVATSAALIVAHGLWEQSSKPEERERIVLFNTVTTLTIGIGVGTLYLGLLLFSAAIAAGAIPSGVMGDQIGHPAGLNDYVHLAWFDASLATVAGALGSMVESDLAVREAAYLNRPDARIEE